ncbi:putative heavy metal-associated domain, HMA [Rosa chinensis]|uniref:Putative heavy metal-associated domain, HMA n=1 Tax=Rosa chinensis TaxID=74649 RepID=A0A2P6RUL6_ROSCH|nr:heavy metal-associated isoprenylated plant protein 28 isoform X2 [Rosa chinensis]PRQ50125.1 putative heavy metal-associated domain, HMA [Rosa chinensis]
MQTIEMRVHMDCPGCESKVRSTLQKLKGIDNVEIDMALQKVTVTGWADQKKVLKTVRKTGRRAELWQFPFNNSNSDNSDVYNQSQCNGPINNYAPQPSSSYNYYKHGYDSGPSSNYGYSQNPAHSSVYGYQPTTAFSDENPNACSVM